MLPSWPSGNRHEVSQSPTDMLGMAGVDENDLEGVPMTTTGGRPAGFHTLTTRIVVADVAAQVAFLRATFDAKGDVVAGRPVVLSRRQFRTRHR